MTISKSHSSTKYFFLCVATATLFIYAMRQADSSPLKALKTASNQFLRQSTTPQHRYLAEEDEEDTKQDQVCGSLDPNNAFTPGQRERADSIGLSLQTFRGGNPMRSFILGGNTQGDFVTEYGIPLIPYVAIWIVFLVIGIVGCLTCCINMCCMHCGCCKCCTKCKLCKCCGQPKKEGKCKTFYTYASVILCTLIVGASCAGAVVSRAIAPSVTKLTCAFMATLQTLQDGSPGDPWVGFIGMSASISVILENYDAIVDDLDLLDTDFEPMNNEYNDAVVEVNVFYETGEGKTVIRVDPAQEEDEYTPQVIIDLGPPGEADTYTYYLVQEMEYKRTKVINSTISLNNDIQNLKENGGSFKAAFSSGKDQSDSLSTSISGLQDSGLSSSNTYSTFSTYGQYGLMLVFAPTLITGIIGVYSTLQVTSMQKKGCNKCVHCSWMGMVFAMSLGLLLTTLLFPLSVVLMEFCNVTGDFFEDPEFFNLTLTNIAGIEGDVTEMAYICVHGDGDIATYLGVYEQLEVFNSIFETLNDTRDIRDMGNGNYSVVIPLIENILINTLTGLYLDSVETTTDLAALNALTNENSNECASGVVDVWVLNETNCTIQTVFEEGDNDPEGLDAAICLAIEIWEENENDVENRYDSNVFPTSACPEENNQELYEYLRTYIERFTTNREQIHELMNTLLDQLQVLNGSHGTFLDEVYDQTEPYGPINETTYVLYDDISHPNTGLFPNSRCNFVGGSLTNVFDAMCIGMVSTMYTTSLSLGIASVISLFGVLSLFCLAKRSIVEFEAKKKSMNKEGDPDDAMEEEQNELNGDNPNNDWDEPPPQQDNVGGDAVVENAPADGEVPKQV